MKLSVVIPYWSASSMHDAMVRRCIDSLRGHDEVLLVTNEPQPDGRAWFAKWVNLGLRLAGGEYRLVLNSDTLLLDGTLADLCIPGTVTSPIINDTPRNFHGCCFCIPATILERYGDLDEGFVGCWEDEDYCCRLYRAGVPMVNVPSVRIWHAGGASYHEINVEAMMHGENEQRFVTRWGARLPELMEADRAAGCFVEPIPGGHGIVRATP